MEPSQEERKFIVGTRSSELAKVQTYEVIDLINAAAGKKHDFGIHEIHNSKGDVDQTHKLYNMGGIGVFCKQLEKALLNKECDIAVHSMKDLPTAVTEGLVVVAIPDLKARDDIVILKQKHKELGSLENLPKGSKIGTSSLRRICTIKLKHPDLKIMDIRGNLNTRLRKLEEEDFDAIILAKAGVERLGWSDKIDQVLDKADFQYPPAQGSLAVQCRADDTDTIELLKLIDNPFSRRIVEAERLYLSTLEGGCTLPISVNAQVFLKSDLSQELSDFKGHNVEDCTLKLHGTVYDRKDHSQYLTHSVEGDLEEWDSLAKQLANHLRENGAQDFIIE